MGKVFLPFITLLLSPCLWAYGDGFSSQGEVTFESRQFDNDDVTVTEDNATALYTRLDSEYQDGAFELAISGYGRVDQQDESRSFATFEDFYASYLFGSREEYKVLAGYKVFNWTALEAFHPADTVNSRNLDSNLENLEKKGELTLELERVLGSGTVNLYFFPHFQRPELPEASSRYGAGVTLNRPIVVEDDDVSKKEYWVPQYGIRVSQYLWDADLSFHYLNRIDRHFPITGYGNFQRVPSPPSPTPIIPDDVTNIVPYYFRSEQLGGALQKPFGGLLFKFEWAYRNFDPETEILDLASLDNGTPELLAPQDHTDVAFGFEHQVHLKSGADLTLLLEHESVHGLSEEDRQRTFLFQNDLLLGFRYAFNDVMGSEFYFVSIWDMEKVREFLINTSYEQRLSDYWKIKGGIKWFESKPDDSFRDTGLEGLNGDEHVFLHLTRYF